MKLKRDDSLWTIGDGASFFFLIGPIWQLSEGLFEENSPYPFSFALSAVEGWDCNVVAKCISHTPSGCQINARANKLSHGYWVYSLTLFCVCWLMAPNLLKGFGLAWKSRAKELPFLMSRYSGPRLQQQDGRPTSTSVVIWETLTGCESFGSDTLCPHWWTFHKGSWHKAWRRLSESSAWKQQISYSAPTVALNRIGLDCTNKD